MGNSLDLFSHSEKYSIYVLEYVGKTVVGDTYKYNEKEYLIKWKDPQRDNQPYIQIPTSGKSRTDYPITDKVDDTDGYFFTANEHRYFAKKRPTPETDAAAQPPSHETGAAQSLRL